MFTKSGFVPRNKPLCLKRQNQLLFGHWPNDFHSSLKHKQEFNLATHWWLLSSTRRCRENILLPVATESRLCRGPQMGRDHARSISPLHISHPHLETSPPRRVRWAPKLGGSESMSSSYKHQSQGKIASQNCIPLHLSALQPSGISMWSNPCNPNSYPMKDRSQTSQSSRFHSVLWLVQVFSVLGKSH